MFISGTHVALATSPLQRLRKTRFQQCRETGDFHCNIGRIGNISDTFSVSVLVMAIHFCRSIDFDIANTFLCQLYRYFHRYF